MYAGPPYATDDTRDHDDGFRISNDPVELLREETSKLIRIVSEQAELLRRIEGRQAAEEMLRQAVPQVPATSSSAWNPLLKSFISETVQPKVERWKSGLDALLVFLGLFSAIVTSFFVASLPSLSQDEPAKTNQLLANLTEIIIILSGVPSSSLGLAPPPQFEPDPMDVRSNSYYSLSLVLSLSIAALAVAGRGFLNMVTWSRERGAALRLTDIHIRWAAAEKTLRPAIEMLPQVLVLPVLLFMVGILDRLLSTVLRISPRSPLILTATGLCLLSILVVAILLIVALIDGGIHPSTSPFQSAFASLLHLVVIPKISSGAAQVVDIYRVIRSTGRLAGAERDDDNHTLNQKLGLYYHSKIHPQAVIRSYHEIVQETHDDNVLDQATSSLVNILDVKIGDKRARITRLEIETFIHLLSAEASMRSNRKAAEIFSATYGEEPCLNDVSLLLADASGLLHPLMEAHGRHHKGRPVSEMWDSPFTLAIAVLLGYDNFRRSCHPLLYLTFTKHASSDWRRQHVDSIQASLERVLSVGLTVLRHKIEELYTLDTTTTSRDIAALLQPPTPSNIVSVDLDSQGSAESIIFLVSLTPDSPGPRWLRDLIACMIRSNPRDAFVTGALKMIQGHIHERPWTTSANVHLAIELVLDGLAEQAKHASGKDLLKLCILGASNALKAVEDPEPWEPFIQYLPRTLSLVRRLIEFQRHSPLTSEYRPKFLGMLSDVVKIQQSQSQSTARFYFHIYQHPKIVSEYRYIIHYVNKEKERMLSRNEVFAEIVVAQELDMSIFDPDNESDSEISIHVEPPTNPPLDAAAIEDGSVWVTGPLSFSPSMDDPYDSESGSIDIHVEPPPDEETGPDNSEGHVELPPDEETGPDNSEGVARDSHDPDNFLHDQWTPQGPLKRGPFGVQADDNVPTLDLGASAAQAGPLDPLSGINPSERFPVPTTGRQGLEWHNAAHDEYDSAELGLHAPPT